MTHGIRKHVARGVCQRKGAAFTSWDAAWAAVSRVPDAVRAYRGRCCGFYHITRYSEDEYAQRVAAGLEEAELECTSTGIYGTVLQVEEVRCEATEAAHGWSSEPRSCPGGSGATAQWGSWCSRPAS